MTSSTKFSGFTAITGADIADADIFVIDDVSAGQTKKLRLDELFNNTLDWETSGSLTVGALTSNGIDDNASSTAVTIDSSGNVGVGKESPVSAASGKALDVSGPVVARGGILSSQTDAGVFHYDSNALLIRAYGATSGTGYITFRTGGGGGSSDAERVRITQDGDVGVGTTNPAPSVSGSSLDASGVVIARGALTAAQTNAGVMNYASNVFTLRSFGATAGTGQMAFKVGGGGGSGDSEAMRIDSSGNLGVNTASPGAKLEVNGTITNSAGQINLKSYTVATVPSAATAGGFIYVSDETGGAIPAFSDGTNWRRVSDRAIVS